MSAHAAPHIGPLDDIPAHLVELVPIPNAAEALELKLNGQVIGKVDTQPDGTWLFVAEEDKAFWQDYELATVLGILNKLNYPS